MPTSPSIFNRFHQRLRNTTIGLTTVGVVDGGMLVDATPEEYPLTQTYEGTLLHEWLKNRDLKITVYKVCNVISCRTATNTSVTVRSYNKFSTVAGVQHCALCPSHMKDFYNFVQKLSGNRLGDLAELYCAVCQNVYILDTDEIEEDDLNFSEWVSCPVYLPRNDVRIRHATFSSANVAPAQVFDGLSIIAKECCYYTNIDYVFQTALESIRYRRSQYDHPFFTIPGSEDSSAVMSAWRKLSQYKLMKQKIEVWNWTNMFINRDEAYRQLRDTLRQCSNGCILSHGTNVLMKLGILEIPKEAFGIEMEYEFDDPDDEDDGEEGSPYDEDVESEEIEEDLTNEEMAERLCQLSLNPDDVFSSSVFRSFLQPSESLGNFARCSHCHAWFMTTQYRRFFGKSILNVRKKFVKFLYENHEAVRGQWIATYDGSLQCGVELVSKPLSVEEYEPYLEAICGAAFENGATTRGGVGMHVHLNREMFSSNVHIARFYDMFTRFRPFLKEWVGKERAPQLSGSADDAWATIDENGFRTPLERGAVCGGHYNAASLDGEYTVEVRIFQSCLVAKEAIEHVELLRAMVEWSRPGNSSIKSSATDFVTWVLEHRRKTYRHLCKRLLKFYSHYKKGIK